MVLNVVVGFPPKRTILDSPLFPGIECQAEFWQMDSCFCDLWIAGNYFFSVFGDIVGAAILVELFTKLLSDHIYL